MTEDTKVILDDGSPSNPANESNQPTVSEEESEWSALKGSTQDRVRQVISERNDYKAKLSSMEEKIKELETKVSKSNLPPPPPQSKGTVTDEQKKAVERLRDFGIATKDDIQALKDQLIIDNEYNRLSSKYSGEDGKPSFNKEKIEAHMKETGIYNPEKAYEDLYKEELYDLRNKNKSEDNSYTVKPSGVSMRGGEPLTMESLQERLRKPDGMEWWNRNREKIIPLMGELSK